MDKEQGQTYTSTSDVIPPYQFILGEPFNGARIQQGQCFSNKEIGIIYAAPDNTLADRLCALGICARENEQGRDVLLVTHPDTPPIFK